jgi:S-DNA-T family DNA segregation ATPase FtsK/SpoIIIE
MLYASSDSSKLQRLQGCYVSDREIERITRYWKSAVPRETTPSLEELEVPEPLIQAELWEEMARSADADDERDPLWRDALGVLKEHSSASTSFLQRKLRIGYSRAARLIDELEEMGYIGPAQGNQPRPILVEFDGSGNVVGPPVDGEEVHEPTEVDIVHP